MKKVIALVCASVMLLTMILPFTVGAEGEGVTFGAFETYTAEDKIDAAPLTFEAVIKVPKSVTGRAGVIFGNYQKDKNSNSFEIYNNGIPRFYGWNGAKTAFEFTEVNVCTGEYVHVAITIDTVNGQAHCYVDGVLKQSVSSEGFTGIATTVNNYMVGGDHRSGNAQYFKGSIKSVAAFSDCRTADEIKADMTKVDTNDDALIVSYDLSAAGDNRLKDASKNSNDLIYSNPNADLEDAGGLTFTDTGWYKVEKPYAKAPVTYEAWVNLPVDYTQRFGVVVGNYGATTPCLSFEIHSGGNPRLYYVDEEINKRSIVFNEVDVRTGDWVHVTIAYDADANEIRCYQNGELKQTVAAYGPIDAGSFASAFGFAGDHRAGNAQYFKGAIKGVTLYSDVRTAEEIKADMTSVNTSDENLLAHYDLTSANDNSDLKDESGNGYNVKCNRTWFKDKEPVTDYAYSFCVVGDTQKVAYLYPEKFHSIYDWIVENKESKKIEFVFGLGDITDKSTEAEWTLCKENIFKLNGVVPYSLVRGNHDKSDAYNTYFKVPEYTKQFEGFYPSNMIENSWRTFSVCDVDYLLITMDYGASDAILNWAAGIIEAHPNHRVIITTHAYLFRDGTTLDVNDVVPPNKSGANDGAKNNGDQMWDKLISQYENIFLVLSGHDPCDNIIVAQDRGVHGNVVTQMLIDPQGVDAAQGATGMVAMLYFSNDGKTLTIENYSTIRDEFYMTSSQMTINIPEYKRSEITVTTPEDTTTAAPTDTAEPDVTTVPNTEKKNGCGNFAFLPVFVSMAALIPAVVFTKKKK